MNANRIPMWTPLYWHQRRLREYVARKAPDFLALLRQHFREGPLRVLDVGCGMMPYRNAFERFTDLEYVGADIPWANCKSAVEIDPKSQRILAPDKSFHGIVHFQVMEHVADYHLFLAECFRVMRPGGAMFCTVPFTFEFHGVPSDYRRWSREGLRYDLAQNGFMDPEVEGVESDFLTLLTLCELYLAGKLGYVITKPVFLGMNILGFIRLPDRGSLPLTNGALCVKPL
jgi:SAM-dependent methyltransferase